MRPEVGTQILRIAGEALTNVRKHAAARRARIQLDVAVGELTLAVEDDGNGFEPQRADGSDWPHYGMRSIRERAASIDAHAEWSSRPGAGTDFRLRVPVHRAEAAA